MEITLDGQPAELKFDQEGNPMIMKVDKKGFPVTGIIVNWNTCQNVIAGDGGRFIWKRDHEGLKSEEKRLLSRLSKILDVSDNELIHLINQERSSHGATLIGFMRVAVNLLTYEPETISMFCKLVVHSSVPKSEIVDMLYHKDKDGFIEEYAILGVSLFLENQREKKMEG